MDKYNYKENNGIRKGTIQTSRGTIHTPTFFPVTTFGDKFPLDKLVQPYLKRLSQCIMVSYHYAKQMKERPNLPIFIDSGGFASLFEGSKINKYKDYATICTKDGEEIHPLDVLKFQEQHADLGATLDFIIPPGLAEDEAKRRQRLTIQNALYALGQRQSKDLFLYASLQCWDEQSARTAAKEYATAGFDGIAIGGLVPRIRDEEYVKRIVSTVREEAPDLALHVFGIGKVELLRELVLLGVDSTDSSSYIRNAVNVACVSRSFSNGPSKISGPHAPLICALGNLKQLQALLHT